MKLLLRIRSSTQDVRGAYQQTLNTQQNLVRFTGGVLSLETLPPCANSTPPPPSAEDNGQREYGPRVRVRTLTIAPELPYLAMWAMARGSGIGLMSREFRRAGGADTD